jgi:hypothetical protein
VRTAITIGWVSTPGRVSAFFGDGRSTSTLDATTGEQGTRSIEEHPSSHVTGSVVEYQGRLYVPVASGEEGQGNNPKYECCKFRGSLVALNASTGALVWKTYTIENEPGPIGTNRSGTTRFGPSGAGIGATVDASDARTPRPATYTSRSRRRATRSSPDPTPDKLWRPQLTPSTTSSSSAAISRVRRTVRGLVSSDQTSISATPMLVWCRATRSLSSAEVRRRCARPRQSRRPGLAVSRRAGQRARRHGVRIGGRHRARVLPRG